MTPDKKTPPKQPKGGRKPWIKKSAIEVFLEQITKQEELVLRLEAQLAKEKVQLEKLQAAKKVIEA